MLVGSFCGRTGHGLTELAQRALGLAGQVCQAGATLLALTTRQDDIDRERGATTLDPMRADWFVVRPTRDGLELLLLKMRVDKHDPRPWLALDRRWAVNPDLPPVSGGQLAYQVQLREDYFQNCRRDPSPAAIAAYNAAHERQDQREMARLGLIINRELVIRLIGERLQVCVGSAPNGEPAILYEFGVEQLTGPQPAVQLLAECEFDAEGVPSTGGISDFLQIDGELRRPEDAVAIPGLPADCWQWCPGMRIAEGELLGWVGAGRAGAGEQFTCAQLDGGGGVVLTKTRPDIDGQLHAESSALELLCRIVESSDLSKPAWMPYFETFFSYSQEALDGLSRSAEFQPHRAWPDLREAMAGNFRSIDGRQFHLAPVTGVSGTVERVDEPNAQLHLVTAGGRNRVTVDFLRGTRFSVVEGQRIGWQDSVGKWPELPRAFSALADYGDPGLWQDIFRRFLTVAGIHDQRYECVHLPHTYVEECTSQIRRARRTEVPYLRLAMQNLTDCFVLSEDGLAVGKAPVPSVDAQWWGYVYADLTAQVAVMKAHAVTVREERDAELRQREPVLA